MLHELESLLLERCPDFVVVLDGELRVLKASAGLRAAVPVVSPGDSFARCLDDVSRQRLHLALSMGGDATSALSLELVHRGRERLLSASWRFFALEGDLVAGIGREVAASSELVDQIETLRRRHQESMAQVASLTGRLRELATIDSLTGVLNRGAFLVQAEVEWQRHLRHRTSLSCATLDIDGFKRVNDTWGHAAGDAVLQHIGALLRATLRASDLPARSGGDEFVALMPETHLDGAHALSERLLARVHARPIAGLAQNVSVTLSIGVAGADGCASLDELLQSSDRALYQAKREGRDRVCRPTAA